MLSDVHLMLVLLPTSVILSKARSAESEDLPPPVALPPADF